MFSLTRQSYLMLALLNLLGFLGNYFHLPLFFGIDFAFGNIAVFLIIYLFGARWGIISALLINSYTSLLWGYPVGVLMSVLEALFIGLTWPRYTHNLLLVEGIFWLCLGLPILQFAHALIIPLEANLGLLLLFKTPINALTNAAIACVLIMLLPLARWAKRPQFLYRPALHQIFLNLIATFVLLPAIITMTTDGWQMKHQVDDDVRTDLQALSKNITTDLRLWHRKYLQALQEVADTANFIPSRPSFNWQHQFQFIQSFFPEFLEITLTDPQGNPLYTYPEKSTVHATLNQADPTPFQQVLANPQPSVFLTTLSQNYLSTPLLVYGLLLQTDEQPRGAVFVYLDLKTLATLYKTYVIHTHVQEANITMTDNTGLVLNSTRLDLAILKPYQPPKNSSFSQLASANFSPPPPLLHSQVSDFWLNATYMQSASVHEDLPLRIIVEVPLRGYIITLLQLHINKFIIIVIIALISFTLAMLISRWITRPLLKLTRLTDNLPTRLEQTQTVMWPKSHIREIATLTKNFKSMAESLQARFEEVHSSKSWLEKRVQIRTQELQQERILLRNLINSMPDLIFYKDRHGVYQGCNKAFEIFAGCQEAELIGKTDHDLFPTEMAKFFREWDDKIIANCKPQTTEAWVLYPEGRRVLLDVIETPFCASKGQIIGLIGTGRDITARKQVEAQLRQSQEMLRLVIDNIPQYIFWKDQNAVYLGCNQQFARNIIGYFPEEIIGKTDADLINTGLAETAFLETLSGCVMADGKVEYQIVKEVQRSDGSTQWLEINKIPLRDAFGQIIGVLGSFEDITERKWAEDKLRQSAKVLENSADAITITDAKSRIILVNKAFTHITGYTLPEVLGKNPSILSSGKHPREFYQKMWNSIHTIGYWEGEIWNRRKNGDIYPEWLHISVIKDEEDETVTNYLAVFSDLTLRKQTEQRLAYLAHYDDLTGLPNRSLFYEKTALAIYQAQQHASLVGVMFLDLDRFKYVNDTWGHVVGDVLLKEVATRLTECLNKTDTIARLGGDDFTILLENFKTAQDLEQTAQTIINAMQVSFDLKGHETFVTASIGISIYPKDGSDIDTLLKNADAAMYRAKEAGRNNYQFFKPQMNIHVHQRLTLESKLRHALERDEFLLYYQPQMHLTSGIIVGAEVLLRWQHPELGLVLPYTFIPLAEETGLIVPIGEWVLRRACLQQQRWSKAGQPLLRISVNLSSRQFRQEDLTKTVMCIVEETNVDPTLLELELTESMLMQDAETAAKTLRQLKDRGIQLAIDDFGTGYSSLNYLKRFPIDKLKIDQSFVRDIPMNKDDMTITRAIVALARSLNLKVIAEGVETKPQEAFLRSLKCDEVQGFLIGRPVPEEEFIKVFRQ